MGEPADGGDRPYHIHVLGFIYYGHNMFTTSMRLRIRPAQLFSGYASLHDRVVMGVNASLAV